MKRCFASTVFVEGMRNFMQVLLKPLLKGSHFCEVSLRSFWKEITKSIDVPWPRQLDAAGFLPVGEAFK